MFSSLRSPCPLLSVQLNPSLLPLAPLAASCQPWPMEPGLRAGQNEAKMCPGLFNTPLIFDGRRFWRTQPNVGDKELGPEGCFWWQEENISRGTGDTRGWGAWGPGVQGPAPPSLLLPCVSGSHPHHHAGHQELLR